MPPAPTHVVFDSGNDLLLTMDLLRTLGEPRITLPAELVELTGPRWAVPLRNAKHLPVVRDLLKRVGIDHAEAVRIPSPIPRRSIVPISKALASCWEPIDLCKVAQQGPRPGSVFDPNSDKLRYVLAAESPQSAKRLFSILTELLTDGIAMRPLSLSSESMQSPWFFWLVYGGQPSLTALQAADRAWWGVSAPHSGFSLFFGWPGELCVGDRSGPPPPTPIRMETLQHVSWDSSNSLVFISPSEPLQLTLRVQPDEPPFTQIHEFASVRTEAAHCLLAKAQPDMSTVDLEVRLRLVSRESPESERRSRERELEDEIHAKWELLQRLQEEAPSDQPLPVRSPYQPFYIYRTPDHQGRQIPRPIERLLIEWTHRSTDLQQLRYQRIAPGRNGAIPAKPIQTLHLLTTASAIGDPLEDRVGFRLRDYRPDDMVLGAFNLLPEWREHHLRIFAPYERDLMRLELYPQLQPCAAAAAKLAEAFHFEHPNDPATYAQWCVLLLPTSGDACQPCLIPTAGFVPLLDAYRWDLSLHVAPDQQVTFETSRSIEDEFVQSAWASVGSSVNVALGVIGHELESQMATVQAECEERDKAIADERGRAKEITKELGQARDKLTDAARRARALGRQARKAPARLDELEGHVNDLSRQIGAAQAIAEGVGQALADLSAALERVTQEHDPPAEEAE